MQPAEIRLGVPVTRPAGAPQRPYDPHIAIAARRGRAWLHDGTEVVLIAVRGGRARIQLPDGRPRTIHRTDLAHVEQP